MKNFVFYIIGCFLIVFCIELNYTETTKTEFEHMKKPVVLKDKTKTTFWYSVVLEDSRGDVYRWGSTSNLANTIGEMYEIGDTINLQK